MRTTGSGVDRVAGPGAARLLCPFDVHVEPGPAILNCELADDPVYDGLELQQFDDPLHGTGMLAFLQRRADGRVDYYQAPGLRLDPGSYTLGAGVGEWHETAFDVARLAIAEDGVEAAVAFTDVAGRRIEVGVDDRDGRPRRRADLLGPVSAAIEHPRALLLVYLHGFDLVRATGRAPTLRIDGRDVATGRLPGQRLHRRLLIKYGAPLTVVELNRAHDGPLPAADAAVERSSDGLTALARAHGDQRARFALSPAFPDLAALPREAAQRGAWTLDVDGARITGGSWTVRRRGNEVDLALEVEDRWRPGPLPPLMRFVTTVVPTFRRWPTTYRWTATVTLGPEPRLASRWERTGVERGAAYRRATGS
jgi:hypothetical protein